MKRRAVGVLTLAAVFLTAGGGQEAAKGLKTFTEPGTLNGEAVSTKKGESAVLVKDGGAVFVNNAEISRRYSGKAGKVETAGQAGFWWRMRANSNSRTARSQPQAKNPPAFRRGGRAAFMPGIILWARPGANRRPF